MQRSRWRQNNLACSSGISLATASLLFQPGGLFHVPGCRTQRDGSRQGQRSQEKEMKTSSFNINYMFSCPRSIYTLHFWLLSDKQCLSDRGQLISNERAAADFSVPCLNSIFCLRFPFKMIEQTAQKRLRQGYSTPLPFHVPPTVLKVWGKIKHWVK